MPVPLISYRDFRPMKPLFVPFFAVFAVAVFALAVQAGQRAVPAGDVVTIRESLLHPLTRLAPAFPLQEAPLPTETSEFPLIGDWITAPLPQIVETYTVEPYTLESYTVDSHTVDKPAERALVFPQPLVPFAPVFPRQETLPTEPADTTGQTTIRGQARMGDEVAGILDQPAPVARGAVDAAMIDPKLTENTRTNDLPDPFPPSNPAIPPAKPTPATPNAQAADPVGYGVLIFVMAITSLGLILMVFVAIDYRQRWMQSLTHQNDRYLGGGALDIEMEDTYGGSGTLYEGYGLTHRSI